MATHSSVLAWRIPGTGEPGGLPSMGSYRVGHDWSDLAAAAGGTSGKEPACQCRRCERHRLDPWVQKILWRRAWQPTPVLSRESHGQRSLEGYSPWSLEELDTTERLPFHFSLSCIGEGNGNPLQCSSLENPRDGRAWWAAVYGVTQSWRRLKWLSSSRSYILNDLQYRKCDFKRYHLK